MATRQRIAFSLSLLALGLAACAGPTGLPQGPTPIPTLIPVREVSSRITAASTPAYIIPSYPARLPSASEGLTIYTAHCVTCHGEDGSGVVSGARNFRDLDYMRGETPANFYTVVTEGRGAMPSFKDKLGSDERWDAVFYVWRLSTSAETLALGAQTYQKDCTACHGDDGSGKLLGSAEFTNQRQMASLAPRDLYLTVTQGRGSMPAWQSRLSQEERWAVIDYIRTFAYDPTLPQVTAIVSATRTPASQPTAATGCSPNQTNLFAWTDASAIKAGQVLYQRCAFCHGTDGKGVLTGTLDFTSAEVRADLKANPGRYLCVLTDGNGAMLALGDSLSPQERWQVLTYLGSLGP